MNEYLSVLKKYADFEGRARRREYWMFVLFNIIFAVAAGVVDSLLGLGFVVYGAYALATLVPSIAVCARRLHDIGKSGWMMLVALIPLIGSIWLIVLLVTDSQPGSNEYGANPKEIAVA